MAGTLTTERALENVRSAAAARARAQETLERAIVAAHEVDGVSLARIGSAAGLSRQRVFQITTERKEGSR